MKLICKQYRLDGKAKIIDKLGRKNICGNEAKLENKITSNPFHDFYVCDECKIKIDRREKLSIDANNRKIEKLEKDINWMSRFNNHFGLITDYDNDLNSLKQELEIRKNMY